MYGQQIGKLEQPLENVVVEEIERDSGLREVHFTIAMKDLPSTAPIAEGVADLAQETVGALFVEGEKDTAFSFPVSFEDYMARVKAAKPGEDILVVYSPVLKGGYDCIGCNIEAIRRGDQPELFYVLTTNDQPEKLCAVGKYKGNHPLAKDFDTNKQGIMAYRLKGSGDDSAMITRMKDGIIEAAAKNIQNKAPLTLSQIAVMTEALMEFDYHTHRVLREGDGPQGYARAVPISPRGPSSLN